MTCVKHSRGLAQRSQHVENVLFYWQGLLWLCCLEYTYPMTKKRPPHSSKTTASKTTATSRRKTANKRSPKRSARPKRRHGFLFWLVKWLLIIGMVASIPFAGWVYWLDRQLVSQFEGQKWQVPSEVYSAPLVLEAGAPWKKEDLEQLLKETGYRFGRKSGCGVGG